MIAGTLKGIVSQRLVRTSDGNGRVACCEILVMTGRVHDMIMDPKLTGQLPEVIAEGSYYGMQTFDQHLLEHLQAGRITMEEAMHVATSPHDFKLMVAAESRTPGKLGSPSRAAVAAPAREDEAGPAPVANPVGAGTTTFAQPAPSGPPPAVASPPVPAPAGPPAAMGSPAPAPAGPSGPPPSAPPPGF
jgi:twitching motility protein PilT